MLLVLHSGCLAESPRVVRTPLFLLSQLLLILFPAFAQTTFPHSSDENQSSYLVRKVSLKGLPADTYFEGMVQDDDGFIWIGTLSGLYRYDGSRITRFLRDPSDSNSLTHNYIKTLAKDTSGNIWIGTFGGALNQYNRIIGKIKRIEPGINDRLRQVIIKVKPSQNKETILAASTKCLFRVSHSLSFVDSFPIPQTPQMLDSRITDFSEYENDKFIIATTAGLFHLDWSQKNNFREIQLPTTANRFLRCIEQDDEQSFWIGTADGVLRMRNVRNNPEFDTAVLLKNHRVFTLLRDPSRRIWVGTNNGLFVARTDNQQIHRIRASIKSDSISNVIGLMVDRLGILWVGTHDNGLYQVYQPDITFQTIPALHTFSRKTLIRAIMEERSGAWLIGTESGVCRYTFSTQKAELLPWDKTHLWSLFKDRNGGIWVATNNCVFCRPTKENTFTHFLHDPKNENSLPFNNIISAAEDEYGNIWMGVYNAGGTTEGLCYYNPSSKTITRIKGMVVGTRSVSQIVAGRDHTMWVGALGIGLYRYRVAGNPPEQSTPVHFTESSVGKGSAPSPQLIFQMGYVYRFLP